MMRILLRAGWLTATMLLLPAVATAQSINVDLGAGEGSMTGQILRPNGGMAMPW